MITVIIVASTAVIAGVHGEIEAAVGHPALVEDEVASLRQSTFKISFFLDVQES
jgi:hypothetical protein